MNRKQRRQANKLSGKTKTPHRQTKMYTGEEIMALRTKAVRTAYPMYMNIFLLSIHDEDDFEYNSYPNHMGKLDRIERRIREKVLAVDDIASYELLRDNLAKMNDLVGVYVTSGSLDMTHLNTKDMVGKKFFYTKDVVNHMIDSSMVAALLVYFAIFILDVYETTGLVSTETGDGPMDRLVDRIWNNIDSLSDQYAQMEFENYAEAMKDDCNMVITGLDEN
ncbi:MAG: hypothetical protein NC548_60450 [Lachnospiraceae bacterium]|nr:hypothetical protein [Lachnospiraceae bacterium]